MSPAPLKTLAAYSHLVHSPVVDDFEALEDSTNAQSPNGLLPTLADTGVEKLSVYEPPSTTYAHDYGFCGGYFYRDDFDDCL